MRRIERDKKIIALMIGLYCRKKHAKEKYPCDSCADVLTYAQMRLDRCPYGENKPSCRACPVHCYREDMRDSIKEVMRFSGPRLILCRPLAYLRHMRRGPR